MFAAPSSSFSCGAADNGVFPNFKHPQQPELRYGLCLDQAATSSSFGLHEVASSFSSFSTLSRNSSDASILLHQHSFQATHGLSLTYAVACAGYGAHHQYRHGLSIQAATHLLPFSLTVSAGLHHHHHHHHHPRLQQQHGLRIQAASQPSLGPRAGNGNLWQQEQNHLCLTLSSTFSCFLCGGGFLQQRQSCPHLHAHSKQHLSLQDQQERLLRRQQEKEITEKQMSEILETIAEYQESLKNTALASTNSQIDPSARGYLPPEFDISSCRSVFVGNIHHKVTLEFLGEVFSTVGTLAGSKLIKKLKSSYGIVEYLDHRAAAVAIATLDGRQLFGLPIKVNWAYLKEQREDKTGHHTIFVGDLGAEITDAALYAFFKKYPSCSDVRVMWNPRSGKSKGYGFVCFKEREDAEKAVEEMTGKMLGSRAIRCNWAAETEVGSEGRVETLKKGRENDPLFTTVYVGNLAQEVTEEELRKEFEALGVGVIENVLIPKEESFGFVKYSTNEEAAKAIKAANGRIIGEKPIMCFWGTKRNRPVVPSEPRPSAAPVLAVEEVLPHKEVKAEG